MRRTLIALSVTALILAGCGDDDSSDADSASDEVVESTEAGTETTAVQSDDSEPADATTETTTGDDPGTSSTQTTSGASDGSGDGAPVDGNTVRVTSGDYDEEFSLTTCMAINETSVQAAGNGEGGIIAVNAVGGSGMLSITPHDSGDPMEGEISSVVVGDTGSIEIKGTVDGDDFTLTGSCA